MDQLIIPPEGRVDFETVADVRREVFRLYAAARYGRMKTPAVYSLCQVLQLGARLMTETEPEHELRKVREANARMAQELEEMRRELEMIRKGAEWHHASKASSAIRAS